VAIFEQGSDFGQIGPAVSAGALYASHCALSFTVKGAQKRVSEYVQLPLPCCSPRHASTLPRSFVSEWPCNYAALPPGAVGQTWPLAASCGGPPLLLRLLLGSRAHPGRLPTCGLAGGLLGAGHPLFFCCLFMYQLNLTWAGHIFYPEVISVRSVQRFQIK
jgi:hypothetical protein